VKIGEAKPQLNGQSAKYLGHGGLNCLFPRSALDVMFYLFFLLELVPAERNFRSTREI
jgi:hypothetical protein